MQRKFQKFKGALLQLIFKIVTSISMALIHLEFVVTAAPSAGPPCLFIAAIEEGNHTPISSPKQQQGSRIGAVKNLEVRLRFEAKFCPRTEAITAAFEA